jgi:hypothetical protein
MPITHQVIERNVHLLTGSRQWTVSRLYSHEEWSIRDDRGNLVETFPKFPQCEEWITRQDKPVVHYPS